MKPIKKLSGGLVSSIFGSDKMPSQEPVKPMPINDDESKKMARRKSLIDQRRRGGRASTVLSKTESLG